jgi:hypothetical protein
MYKNMTLNSFETRVLYHLLCCANSFEIRHPVFSVVVSLSLCVSLCVYVCFCIVVLHLSQGTWERGS